MKKILLLALLSGCGTAGATLDVVNDGCPRADVWVSADGASVIHATLESGARASTTDTGITGGERLQITANVDGKWESWGADADGRPVITLRLICGGSVRMRME